MMPLRIHQYVVFTLCLLLSSLGSLYAPAQQHASAVGQVATDERPISLATSNYGQQDSTKVRVGVYCDVGAGSSSKNLMKSLERFDDLSVKKLMADDIRSGTLAELDVLIHPGGTGGGQGRHLGAEGREEIRGFIGDGGGFIGICAGAYLASADYTWSLNVLDAKVVDRKHWARGKGTVKIALTDAGRRILKSDEKQLKIFYAQGPLLAPQENPDIPDYEVLAAFETEVVKEGVPGGVMKGTTAIAAGQFGRGRVLCFSPHPELTKGMDEFVRYAIDHVTPNRSPE